MFNELFPDDEYDLPESDSAYIVVVVDGGWRIFDPDEPERFKAVFSRKDEAQEMCQALNYGQSYVDRWNDAQGEARYYSD